MMAALEGPLPQTHHNSGQCVALSEKTGIPVDQLTYEQLKGIDTCSKEDISAVYDYEKGVEMRSAAGRTSKKSVEQQISVLKDMLAEK